MKVKKKPNMKRFNLLVIFPDGCAEPYKKCAVVAESLTFAQLQAFLAHPGAGHVIKA